MQFINEIPVWGELVDAGALSQIETCARTANPVALMADHHKGYAVPIDGVVAYRSKVSWSGVGYDLARGNKAVLTDAPASEVRAKIKTIMDDVWKNLEFQATLKMHSNAPRSFPKQNSRASFLNFSRVLYVRRWQG